MELGLNSKYEYQPPTKVMFVAKVNRFCRLSGHKPVTELLNIPFDMINTSKDVHTILKL